MPLCPQCSSDCGSTVRFCPSCGFPVGALKSAAGDPLVGRTIGGNYVILEMVGSGGMGKVYRAEQTSLAKTVAVKVIHPHLISDESATARFYTEARASSRLNHPNSVSVLDFGRTDDGLLFLAMEFLRGKDLAHVIWEEGPLESIRSANILRQILAALSEAHDLDIIHRDIKPENILIDKLRTGGDFVKVVDFGLAKVRADVAPSVTMPGIVCGTPDYMAPEQGRGDQLDCRSDLYSCGVLLYQMVTGRLPFEAESPTQTVLAHMTQPLPDPRGHVPGLPEPIVKVLFRSLEKKAANRYQTAVEFVTALEAASREIERERNPTPKSESSACPSCGAQNPTGLKFCGECGVRLLPAASPPAVRPSDPSPERSNSLAPPEPAPPRTEERPSYRPSLMSTPLLGRDGVLEELQQHRARATAGKPRTVRIVAEAGVGKSALLRSFLERVKRKGDAVLHLSPEPTGSGMVHAPLRNALRAALRIPDEVPLSVWLGTESFRNAPNSAVAMGLETLLADPPSSLDPRSRFEALVRAVAWALQELSATGSTGVVVLACEQLQRFDPATLSVLARLRQRDLDVPVLLVATHAPRVDPRWEGAEVIHLSGLDRTLAMRLLRDLRVADAPEAEKALALVGNEISPLYVEQLARWIIEGGDVAPSRLVDLIAARFERADPGPRRALQALALLGEGNADTLQRVAHQPVDRATLIALQGAGWVRVLGVGAGARWAFAHELLREVAEASIPQAARRDLHSRCAELLSEQGAPPELRAAHATDGGESFEALLLLERVGDRRAAVGDDLGAALALRRGLDRARRELLRGEGDDPERAMGIFARKLAEVLLRAGEIAEAEGVLREAMEMVPRASTDHARLANTLARVLNARGRGSDAVRVLEDANRTAKRLGAYALAAELTLTRAELEEVVSERRGAVEHLRASEELLREAVRQTARAGGSGDVPLQKLRCDVLLRLSHALRDGGDLQGAQASLAEATEVAEQYQFEAERLRCDGEAAAVTQALGRGDEARSLWRRAASRAEELGDPLAQERFLANAS